MQAGYVYNGLLVNWYDGGTEGMGAHADDEAAPAVRLCHTLIL